MNKKLVSLLLVVAMLTTLAVGCGPKEEPEQPVDNPVNQSDESKGGNEPSEVAKGPSGQLIVGNGTELTGDWTPYWQNDASDYDFWHFITGTSTVDMTFGGEFVINKSVVEKHEITKNDDGSKTHTWTIKDGLVYNDGTPITAKDYVASIMFWSSSILGEMQASNDYGYYYTGWKDFSVGDSKIFSGVRLIDDKTFAVTIAAENLPYFYELALVDTEPLKLSFWTDDKVEIKDDGNGCYFSDNFTFEAYEAKINEARNSIIYPSSGAYVVESYDEASKTGVLKINKNFVGDYTGQKPSIETIIYKKVNDETQMDELSTGSVDMLLGMMSGTEINAGLDLVDKGGYSYTTYPRAGYGKIQFQCDFGPTQYVEVRQAICHLLDRNDFAKTFTGGFGSVVNGPYGEAQWFYQENKSELNKRLNQYPYSLEDAIKLLEDGGWVYDANGNEYKEGIRYKKTEDGKLMPLIIEWASSEKNQVSDLLVVKLQENPDVATAGMKINQTVMTFGELLNYLYRDGSEDPKYGVPTYGMYNLATGFNPRYDRTTDYTTDPDMVAQGYNTNFILDEQLAKLAKEMVLTDSEDREGFKAKFVDFIDRWNELMPDVPLYSNIIHDFYNEKLKDYNNNPLVRIDQALLYSYVAE